MDSENDAIKKISDNIIPVYKNELCSDYRYLLIYGGAGSGKSYFAAQKIMYRMLTDNNHKILLVRKVAKTIRNSQFALLKSLISDNELNKDFKIKETDLVISYPNNNNMILSVGLDDREKLKSIHGITSIWIEEATEIDKRDFLQIDLRLRNETNNYKQIIMTFNPVKTTHWLYNKQLPDSKVLVTSYKDNPHLDESYLKMLENMKYEDQEYFDIYALGNWACPEAIIYKPFEIIKSFPSEFDEIIYGLDFGYINPTALVKVGIKDSRYYLEEKIYETKLTNNVLISKLKNIVVPRKEIIYCDQADPGKMKEIENNGFIVRPAKKNVLNGIDFIRSVNIFSKPDNLNINREILEYKFKTDRNGYILEEPEKFNDHCMDAIRYAIYTHAQGRRIIRARRI